MKNLRIALNLYLYKLLEKISRSKYILLQMGNNPAVFTNSTAETAIAAACIINLENAATDAEGGDVYKIAVRDAKEQQLITAMDNVARSVQNMPNLTEEIVSLAGMELRKTGGRKPVEGFDAMQGAGAGKVKLRVKAQKSTFYKWEYCLDPLTSNTWVEAVVTEISSATITVPETGVYWFRVVFVQTSGEHEQPAVKFAVN